MAWNHVLNSYLAWYEIFKTNQLTSDKQFENEKTVAGLCFQKIELPFTILGLYGFKTYIAIIYFVFEKFLEWFCLNDLPL